MKQLFLLTLICACIKAHSQNDVSHVGKKDDKKIDFNIFPIDSNTKLITYTEVVYLNDSVSKSELFSREKSTIAAGFLNVGTVTTNEDKDADVILVNGSIHESVTFLGAPRDVGVVTFKLKLSCRDGRYRYLITDFILYENENIVINLEQINKPLDLSTNQWKELRNDVNKKIRNLVASIKTKMNEPSARYDKW